MGNDPAVPLRSPADFQTPVAASAMVIVDRSPGEVAVRLCKGFEVEMYTGIPTGEIVGLSDRIARDLQGFVREPDSRNVEYTTAPLACYDRLLCALVRPRLALRQYLQTLGDYTIVPGSTLSLGDSHQFFRSDPGNPYHTYIEQTYGTDIVTASIHINIGISDPEDLIRACRLVRLEAPLYLALSASSPFLDGKPTGMHSTRWSVFPQTPQNVPLFEDHAHFIRWTQEQLEAGTMQNVRHLWCSVRPNGDNRPYDLNRLELRICDLVIDPIELLGITALLEARLAQMLADPSLDPLEMSSLNNADLVALAMANEAAVARQSLDAPLNHWEDGRPILARDWIADLVETVAPVAKANGYGCFLAPVRRILREGNTAQKWLQSVADGATVQETVAEAITTAATQERDLEDKLCQELDLALAAA